MFDFHEGRVFRPNPIIEDIPLEQETVSTDTPSIETPQTGLNDVEEKAKDIIWGMLPQEEKNKFIQVAAKSSEETSPIDQPVGEISEPTKSFGGTIGAPSFIEDTEDMARRLILWSSAVAPLTTHRADGGAVNYPLAKTEEAKDSKKKHATIKKMKPQEFLNETDPLHIGKGDREIIDTFKSDIKAGNPLGPLKIYEDGKQDGRHRANAAKEVGVKSVPVIDYRKAGGGSVIKKAINVLSKHRGK